MISPIHGSYYSEGTFSCGAGQEQERLLIYFHWTLSSLKTETLVVCLSTFKWEVTITY